MKFRASPWIVWVAVGLVMGLLIIGCSDDEEPIDNDSNSHSTAPNSDQDASDDHEIYSCGEGEVEHPESGECVSDLPEDCASIEGEECFSNYDCGEGFRCADLSGEGVDSCCISGAVGDGEAGEECGDVDGEAFCESAICIGSDNFPSRCSTTCTDESDCPSSMQMCNPIMFSSSVDNWCFPTE